MVMFPQWKHYSSTNAVSVCWKPRCERQRSWLSDEARKRPHPETHERKAIFKKMPVTRGALLDIALLEKKSVEVPRRGRSATTEWERRHAQTKQQHWTATSADAPSQQHCQTLRRRLGSKAKSWCAFARGLLLYPRYGAGCMWRTLKGDWALGHSLMLRKCDSDWLKGDPRLQPKHSLFC